MSTVPTDYTKANTGPSASTPFAPTGPVCKEAEVGRGQETGGESLGEERVTLKRMEGDSQRSEGAAIQAYIGPGPEARLAPA